MSFINAATDALLYRRTFCSFAEETGLGSYSLGTTLYNPESIIDTPQLPQLVMPVVTIILGWPNETPELSGRPPLLAIIHDEIYQDYTPEWVGQFCRKRGNLPGNAQLCQVNEKEILAQVFTDIRYTKKDNEAMSKNLLDTPRQQGSLQKPRLESGLTYR